MKRFLFPAIFLFFSKIPQVLTRKSSSQSTIEKKKKIKQNSGKFEFFLRFIITKFLNLEFKERESQRKNLGNRKKRIVKSQVSDVKRPESKECKRFECVLTQ